MPRLFRNAIVTDNRGAGDCMFHATAISLMYKLRANNNHEESLAFLREIGLTEFEATLMQGILTHKNKNGQFEQEQLDWIQKILSPQLRYLSAKNEIANIQENPISTDFFTAIQYKIRTRLASKTTDETILESLQTGASDNYASAEVFRIKLFEKTIHKHIDSFIEAFAKLCSTFSKSPKKDKAASIDKSKMIQQVDEFVNAEAMKYFKNNEKKLLTAYETHLMTPGRWGNEKELGNLTQRLNDTMRSVKQKRKQKVLKSRNNDFISLDIQVDGNDSYSQKVAKSRDLVLENRGNAHWVSDLPAQIYLQNLRASQPENEFLLSIVNLMENTENLLRHNSESADKSKDRQQIRAAQILNQNYHQIIEEIADGFLKNKQETAIALMQVKLNEQFEMLSKKVTATEDYESETPRPRL